MTQSPQNSAADGPPWFFNVRTGLVEGRSGAKSADRLGPYSTREEAQEALARVQARNDVWDEQDKSPDEDEDRS